MNIAYTSTTENKALQVATFLLALESAAPYGQQPEIDEVKEIVRYGSPALSITWHYVAR